MSRRSVIAAAVAGTLMVAGVSAVLVSGSGAGSAPATAAPTGTATVVRTNLATTQQVNGTLGFDGGYTVLDLVGTTAAQRGAAQVQLAQAVAQQRSGNQAAADARATTAAQLAADQAQIDQYTAAVAADQRQLTADADQQSRDTAQQAADCGASATPSLACTADRTAAGQDAQRVATDQSTLTKDQQSLTQAQGKIGVDRAQGQQNADTAQSQADSAAAQADAIQSSGSTTAPTTITWLPRTGDTITPGSRLYALDGRPVVLLTGDTPILRPLGVGVADGPDVAVLEQNLAVLGFAPGIVDEHFDQATATAVRQWQKTLGETQTGVVALGDVFVEPTAVRVTTVNASAGGPATPGSTVLTGTSTTPVVTVPLSPGKEYLVHAGDAVAVDLPDGRTTVTGHVRDVSRVATTPPSNSSSTPNIQSQQQGQQALATNTTIAVTVTFDTPNAVPTLDQAPVQVDITDQTVKGVLAVPVDALLALAGGGYGLQLAGSGGTRVVAVRVGLFGNGQVQVSGPGVTQGAIVEVPAS
jgi:hypothetical protein